MKKIFLMAIAICSLAFTFTGCSNSDPLSVAEAYVKGIQDEDPKAVVKLIAGYDDADAATRAYGLEKMTERILEFNQTQKEFFQNLSFDNIQEKGDDRATAVFKDKTSGEEFEVDLKKEDGKWVVDL